MSSMNNLSDNALHDAYVDLSHVRSLIAAAARKFVASQGADTFEELEALLIAEEGAKCRFTMLAREAK